MDDLCGVAEQEYLSPMRELPASDTLDLAGLQHIERQSPLYPAGLESLADPPLRLSGLGDLRVLNRPSIAVVGSRNASHYGLSVAEKLAFDLAAAGFVVVSGFARGIDSAAHKGALRAGGKTVAVLGCGLAVNYPKSNRGLRDVIAAKGALISEFEPLERPYPANFPRRNRIIAGLSVGLVVVEAKARSGSLISARQALDAGREVFAVPGPVSAGAFEGCHALLKEGAVLVEHAGDVVSSLPEWVTAAASPMTDERALMSATAPDEKNQTERSLSKDEHHVLEWLGEEPLSLEAIAHGLSILPSVLIPILTQLELKARVVRLGASYMAKRSVGP